MADRDLILAPQTATITVALEPVYNVMTSFMLLAGVEHQSGFGDWIVQTASQLSPERKHTHRLVFDSMSLVNAVIPEESWSDFPAYIEHLKTKTGDELRNQAVHWVRWYKDEWKSELGELDQEAFLKDEASFLHVMEFVCNAKSHKMESDIPFFKELYRVLSQPAMLKETVISHLMYMWYDIMAPEWERVKPMLQEAVEAFQQIDYSDLTAVEAARRVTTRDLSSVWTKWNDRITFIPNAHIGPYVMRFDSDMANSDTWLAFGARLPEGARTKSPALSRSELLVQLNALADDTRLRILELLTQHQELCAQDIITLLDLSQSSASRHLRQLTASGYVTERRREVAKCYTINQERAESTLTALKGFLQGK